MVQTLDGIKGGGGSIRVGTTGKIGALMSRELEYVRSTNQAAPSSSKALTDTETVPSGVPSSKILKSRRSLDETSSSSSCSDHKGLRISQKTKGRSEKTYRIPMLGSDIIALDGTPTREKADKGSYLAEVVDIKCRNTERTWAKPIKKQIKKLGFSKLSASIV